MVRPRGDGCQGNYTLARRVEMRSVRACRQCFQQLYAANQPPRAAGFPERGQFPFRGNLFTMP